MRIFSIILADDEQQILYGMKKGIEWEKLGFRVAGVAQNGKEALELMEEVHPDLVISDIKMPFMDGLELAKHIHEDYMNTKVILFSGWDDFEYARNAIKVKALDYLLKPCDINDLLAVMDMAIQKLDKEKEEKVLGQFIISADNKYNEANSYNNSNKYVIEKNKKDDIPKRIVDNVRNSDEQTTIKYLREYVENNYIYDITMQEAAEEMGYSDAYFSKLFKQYFNQNFTAYLTEYRIKKAKELLCNTNKSIKDISRMVGYTDSNYFARIFKRIVGEIPSKYREDL